MLLVGALQISAIASALALSRKLHKIKWCACAQALAQTLFYLTELWGRVEPLV